MVVFSVHTRSTVGSAARAQISQGMGERDLKNRRRLTSMMGCVARGYRA